MVQCHTPSVRPLARFRDQSDVGCGSERVTVFSQMVGPMFDSYPCLVVAVAAAAAAAVCFIVDFDYLPVGFMH